MQTPTSIILTTLDELIQECHRNSLEHGFWDGENYQSAGPKKIALMHSELSEALEAMREGNYHGEGHTVCEELADCIIRIFDYAGAVNLDLPEVLIRKMARNRERPYKHGKAF